MRTGLAARFVIGCLLAGGAFAARAQSLDQPVLLVASPKTTGFYNHAVLLVVPTDAGHVGFIINRATRTTVASAFPEEPDSAKVIEPIYLGGPRAAQSLYAVVRRDPPTRPCSSTRTRLPCGRDCSSAFATLIRGVLFHRAG